MSACLARPYAESAVPPPRPHLASQPALPKPVAGGQVSSGRQKRSHNGRRRDDDTDRALPEVYVGRRQPAIPLQGECHDDPGGEPGGEGGHSRIWPTAAYPVLGGGESLRNAFSKSGSGPRSKREVPHRAIGGGTSLQKRACCWGGRPPLSHQLKVRTLAVELAREKLGLKGAALRASLEEEKLVSAALDADEGRPVELERHREVRVDTAARVGDRHLPTRRSYRRQCY
jgi:hypothetical protein